MKKAILSLLLAAAGSICLAQPAAPADLYVSKTFSDATFNQIAASTSHGNIDVVPASDADAKVEVFIRRRENGAALSKVQVQQLLDEYYSLDISVSGEKLTVAAREKKAFFNGDRMLSISFKIYSGKNKTADLETDHGNLSLAGLTGTETLSTDHGNIDATNISGRLTAKTSHGNITVAGSKQDIDATTDHGDIEVRECDGKVRTTTSNGNIRLTEVNGNVKAGTDHGNVSGHLLGGELIASTSHGDISLRRLSCSVEASTDHGNLAVYFDKLSGNVVLDNSSGNIALQLPKGKALDLDLRGRKVNVNAIENFTGQQENESIRGTLNGGGSKVSARTDKGQVDLAFK